MFDLSRDALVRMERCRHERTVPHPVPKGYVPGPNWDYTVVRCVDCGLPLEQRA